MLRVQSHAACLCLCCMSMFMSVLYVHDDAAWPCPCCMLVSILHVRVPAVCPRSCCIPISMSILHVRVHAVCPCPCCMSMSMSMLHAHAHVRAACPCPFCMSMTMSILHVRVQAAYPCPWYIQHINAGMPDCPASGQYGTGMKKTNDAGRNRSGTGLSWSSPAFFWSGTGIKLWMPMPAIVSSMPMPSYAVPYVFQVRTRIMIQIPDYLMWSDPPLLPLTSFNIFESMLSSQWWAKLHLLRY